MIRTIYWIHWKRWLHNRPEIGMTLIVPLAFFSIFAMILGDRSRVESKTRIGIAWCDELKSELSREVLRILQNSDAIAIINESDAETPSSNRRDAMRLVRDGKVSVAVLWSHASDQPSDQSSNQPTDPVSSLRIPSARLLTDTYDKVSARVVAATLQQAMAQALDSLAKQRRSASQDASGIVVTAAVRWTQDNLPEAMALPQVEIVDLLGKRKTNPVVAMYAAGIAVMFLLFSTTAASGSLLDERENNTLDRLLASRMSMDDLLLGKWCFLTSLGVVQLSVMFAWAQLVFQVQVWSHFASVAIMTLVTAGAASSLALLLATLCTSRSQLSWVSVVVVLSMSALGGSMVPRYLMSDRILHIGQWTFNAWALDGFNKIFWRELPLSALRLELTVLLATAGLLLIAARLIAARWDRCRSA